MSKKKALHKIHEAPGHNPVVFSLWIHGALPLSALSSIRVTCFLFMGALVALARTLCRFLFKPQPTLTCFIHA
jgi:hypothetical protein